LTSEPNNALILAMVWPRFNKLNYLIPLLCACGPKTVEPQSTNPALETSSHEEIMSTLDEPVISGNIAVLELSSESIPDLVLTSLTDELRAGALTALRETDASIMTRESIVAVLTDMGIDAACVEGQCEVETARNLRASYVVSGSVITLEGQHVLSVKLHDVQTGELLATERVSAADQLTLLDESARAGEALFVNGLNVGASQPEDTSQIVDQVEEVSAETELIHQEQKPSGDTGFDYEYEDTGGSYYGGGDGYENDSYYDYGDDGNYSGSGNSASQSSGRSNSNSSSGGRSSSGRSNSSSSSSPDKIEETAGPPSNSSSGSSGRSGPSGPPANEPDSSESGRRFGEGLLQQMNNRLQRQESNSSDSSNNAQRRRRGERESSSSQENNTNRRGTRRRQAEPEQEESSSQQRNSNGGERSNSRSNRRNSEQNERSRGNRRRQNDDDDESSEEEEEENNSNRRRRRGR